jgi:hypothetical protein
MIRRSDEIIELRISCFDSHRPYIQCSNLDVVYFMWSAFLCFRNYATAVLPSSTCGNRVMFLCCYKFGSNGRDSQSSRSCLVLFGDYLHCRDLRCWRLWPLHLHCLWQCSSLIATAFEIVFWYIYNVQNLCFTELMMYNLFVYAVRNDKNLLDDWFVHFILPHVLTFRFIIWHNFWRWQFYEHCASAIDARGGGASGWMPYSALLFRPVVSSVVSNVYAWYYICKYRLLKVITLSNFILFYYITVLCFNMNHWIIPNCSVT